MSLPPIVPGVNVASDRPGAERRRPEPTGLALHHPPAHGAAAWLRLVVLGMLAWAASLLSGLGGMSVAHSQPLAVKLAPAAQHLLRQTGSSPSPRAARRDLSAEVRAVAQTGGPRAPWQPAEPELAWQAPVLLVPTQHVQGMALPDIAAAPRVAAPERAHPSRAPPPQA